MPFLWFRIDSHGQARYPLAGVGGSGGFAAGGGDASPKNGPELRDRPAIVLCLHNLYQKRVMGQGADLDTWLSYIKERAEYWRKEEKQRKIAAPFE